MPEFGSPFSGLASNRKLTDKELIRGIRFMNEGWFLREVVYTCLKKG